ncbi:hypothetical protein H4I96_01937 [Botrytis cinerea]
MEIQKIKHGQKEDDRQKSRNTWRVGERYGEDFWLKEYGRFSRIFSDNWNLGGTEAGVGQRGRKLIASLPGNHDLGFGAQIKVPIRDRFEVYFGDVNRVDVIANHTFVSVDSVSLSAGASERPISETAPITKPVEEFLNNVQVSKRKAVARELDFQAGKERAIQYSHSVQDVELADYAHLPTLDPGPNGAEFPTILLTHVPLYRNPGTPCGPLREHWPPTPPPKGQTMPVIPDHRNAISVSKGYQYQKFSVFSGDDHDYCELVHPEDKKSRPRNHSQNMWNPVGADGKPLHSVPTGHGAENTHTSTTMESHLCLLPDQIGILINYGILVGISLLLLIIRAILVPFTNLTPFALDSKGSSSGPGSPIDSEFSLLPTSIKDLKREDEEEKDRRSEGNSSTSSTATVNNVASRTSRTRTSSPANGYGLPGQGQGFSNGVPYQQAQPLIEKAGYYGG